MASAAGCPDAGAAPDEAGARRRQPAEGDGDRRRQHPRPCLADGHRRPPCRHRRTGVGPCRRDSPARPVHDLLRRAGSNPPLRPARGTGGLAMESASIQAPAGATTGGDPEKSGLSTKAKVLIGFGAYFAISILLLLIFGNYCKNEAFKPQNEFKLEPWVTIELAGIDFSINKAVLYLFLASALTIAVMVWIARRMAEKPNRVQTAVEVAY